MHVLGKLIRSLDKSHIAIFKIVLKVIKEYVYFGGCGYIILINKLVPGSAELIYNLMVIAAEKLTIAELVELINTQENILELFQNWWNLKKMNFLQNGSTLVTFKTSPMIFGPLNVKF